MSDALGNQFQFTDRQKGALEVLRSDAENVGLFGGSRSGKTFLLLAAIVMRALSEPGTRHVIFRFRFKHIKSSIVLDTLPKTMRLVFPGLYERCHLDKSDWYLKIPAGVDEETGEIIYSEIWFAGLDDKERTEKILGMEFATIYFNEATQIPWQSVVMAQTRLAQKCEKLRLKIFADCNPTSKRHWTYRWIVANKDPETNRPVGNQRDFGHYYLNPHDNQANIAASYLKRLEGLPERAKIRFLYGRFTDDDDGDLFTEQTLAINRRGLSDRDTIPEMQRIAVVVDPSGARGDEDFRSDEIGIVVVGVGTDGHGYLIEDLSIRARPEVWAQIVVEAFERHKADMVVGETNYGGDMVRAVLQSQNVNLPFTEVTATRGKVIRAEPVSNLYDRGKIHHVGYFPELEDQLQSFTVSGYEGARSPDRADALIWGITYLFPSILKEDREQKPTPNIKVKSSGRVGRN